MRWRQCRHTGEFIPIDESAKKVATTATIQGDIQTFISPVDGSIISDRKQLREHNKRNNVVSADEFTPEFYERKAKERAQFYQGEYTREESFKRKQEIYNNIIRLEREG